ncbi:MAG: hypothetical protein ABJF10_03390 [Chthoniobacter sp.]|uniref:hypothetical protein n=1 Tax=Chthoniobacter sp. TaxID=2510640 RepID=UPI0032A8E4FD
MKNTLLTISLLLLTKLAACAVVDLGTTTDHTPYDRFLSPVKDVFNGMHGEGASMDKVQSAMRTGRSFRYAHSEPYLPATPQETASKHTGDCKDKALWLMDQLQDPSARFVIGKMTRGAKLSHAWVMWQHDGQWWILDCTMLSRPIAADKVSANEYVPLYSYSRSTAFRHSDKAGLTADVAGTKQSPVAETKATKALKSIKATRLAAN